MDYLTSTTFFTPPTTTTSPSDPHHTSLEDYTVEVVLTALTAQYGNTIPSFKETMKPFRLFMPCPLDAGLRHCLYNAAIRLQEQRNNPSIDNPSNRSIDWQPLDLRVESVFHRYRMLGKPPFFLARGLGFGLLRPEDIEDDEFFGPLTEAEKFERYSEWVDAVETKVDDLLDKKVKGLSWNGVPLKDLEKWWGEDGAERGMGEREIRKAKFELGMVPSCWGLCKASELE
ncbi:MAG: hypothetical protein Q9220_001874 [cf. Caloplaca sp. 1 TL-2023]